MSNASPAKEPSMEEILASIRRIIESGDERPVLGGLGTKLRDRGAVSVPSPGAEANDSIAGARRRSIAPASGVADTGVEDAISERRPDGSQSAEAVVEVEASREPLRKATVARAQAEPGFSIGNTDAASSLESAIDAGVAGREATVFSRSGSPAAEPVPASILAWPQAEPRATGAGRSESLDEAVLDAESPQMAPAFPTIALSDADRTEVSTNDMALADLPAASAPALSAQPPAGGSSAASSMLAALPAPLPATAETHDFSLEFDEESFSAELSGEFGPDAPSIDVAQPNETQAPEAKDEGDDAAPASVMAEASSLMSQEAGAQVAAAFDDLARAIRDGQMKSMEDMAREMLRPMLQEWLDDNLPRLVEKLVREEIERVARGPRR